MPTQVTKWQAENPRKPGTAELFDTEQEAKLAEQRYLLEWYLVLTIDTLNDHHVTAVARALSELINMPSLREALNVLEYDDADDEPTYGVPPAPPSQWPQAPSAVPCNEGAAPTRRAHTAPPNWDPTD